MAFLTSSPNAWYELTKLTTVDVQVSSVPLPFSVNNIPLLIESFFLPDISPSTEELQCPYWLHKLVIIDWSKAEYLIKTVVKG